MLSGRIAVRETGAAVPALDCGRVNVWLAQLDHPREHAGRLARLLDSRERDKAARFRFDEDRDRFVAATGVLRTVLGSCLAEDPRRIAFRRGRFGKPALREEFGGGRVRFNLSHSGGAALVAVALDREVGVDVEFVRPLESLEELAATAFSPAERDALRRLPDEERRRAFFDCWTRKEAFVKAVGEGMSCPPDAFDVSVAPGAGPRAIAVRRELPDSRGWSLRSMDVHPAYAAAVVAEGADWELDLRRWSADGLC